MIEKPHTILLTVFKLQQEVLKFYDICVSKYLKFLCFNTDIWSSLFFWINGLKKINLGFSFSWFSLCVAVFPDRNGSADEWYHCSYYKHTTRIASLNDIETVVFTSFQRGTHVVCLCAILFIMPAF